MSQPITYLKLNLAADKTPIYLNAASIAKFREKGKFTEVNLFSREDLVLRIGTAQFAAMLNCLGHVSVIDATGKKNDGK